MTQASSPTVAPQRKQKAGLRTCIECQGTFEVTEEDLTFYEEASLSFAGNKCLIDPPKDCPDCRYQKRLAWRNERNLYRRTCDATGKNIVSIWSQDKEHPPVYDREYWWSDSWDPKDYGRDFNENTPFFEQFAELFRAVPQVSLNNVKSENSEFTNQAERNSDCYMCVCTNASRDCLYGMWIQHCMNSMDCLYLEHSELCYEVFASKKCYRCTFSSNLDNCSDVHCSQNCRGCSNCFGCINLQNKQYYFYNEECSKEEYEEKIRSLGLEKFSSLQSARKHAKEIAQKAPYKFYTGHTTEGFSGDYVQEVKNSWNIFNCRYCENVSYSRDAWDARNCRDITETLTSDFCLSIEGSADNSRLCFCMKCSFTNDSLYCSHCMFSNDLFGCVGLKHARYCILNKQYTKEEYEQLVPKIVEHMRSTGEWGQHFPIHHSCLCYNETVAQEYFPLTKEEVEAKGWKWKNAIDDLPNVEKVIPADKLPDSINDIPDDILNWAIVCEATERPFKIIKQELDFYRSMNLPIPHLHPDERHKRRMALRNPRKLWERKCDKCAKDMESTYSPERKETVYCEECYLKEVY